MKIKLDNATKHIEIKQSLRTNFIVESFYVLSAERTTSIYLTIATAAV